MPLISGLTTTVTTVTTGVTEGLAKAAKEAEKAGKADKTTEPTAAADEPKATDVSDPAPADAAPAEAAKTPSATYKSYSAPKSDDTVIASVMANYEPEERDDKVNASDYARRAAIATQAKLKAEAMFDGFETEAFSPLLEIRKDADAAYSKSDAPFRYVEKQEVEA